MKNAAWERSLKKGIRIRMSDRDYAGHPPLYRWDINKGGYVKVAPGVPYIRIT